MELKNRSNGRVMDLPDQGMSISDVNIFENNSYPSLEPEQMARAAEDD
jgi:hypothetical protein